MSKMKLKLLFTFIALSSIITVYSVNKQRINEFINNSIVEALSNDDEYPRLIPYSSSDWFLIPDETKSAFSFYWKGVKIDVKAGIARIICCGDGEESDYCNPYAINIDTEKCKEHDKGRRYNW